MRLPFLSPLEMWRVNSMTCLWDDPTVLLQWHNVVRLALLRVKERQPLPKHDRFLLQPIGHRQLQVQFVVPCRDHALLVKANYLYYDLNPLPIWYQSTSDPTLLLSSKGRVKVAVKVRPPFEDELREEMVTQTEDDLGASSLSNIRFAFDFLSSKVF